MEYKVLLFYYFKLLPNVVELFKEHKKFCEKYDFKGRIIFSYEGINGTLSGKTEDCIQYMEYVKTIIAKDIDFKIDECLEHVFDKLTVKHKDTIIKIGDKSIKPYERTGKFLKPSEFKEMMKQEDSIVFDVRSNYEHNLGCFRDAVTFNIGSMYEFPEVFSEHELNNFKNFDRPILTYCTGGIKCEKASAYLMDLGFRNVYQLHGGIIKYRKEVEDEDFLGKCYVFDKRLSVDVNKINPEIISKCYSCGVNCDKMVNCMKTKCNRHTTMCKTCYNKWDSCCSKTCSLSDDRRRVLIDYE